MNNDLISRKELKKTIQSDMDKVEQLTDSDKRWIKYFNDIIDYAPTVKNEYMRGYEAAEREYKRPQGEWIKVRPFLHKCSICGRTLKDVFDDELASDYPFCHCGADMQGKEE